MVSGKRRRASPDDPPSRNTRSRARNAPERIPEPVPSPEPDPHSDPHSDPEPTPEPNSQSIARPPPHNRIQLYNRLRELSARFHQISSNWQPCNCPNDCLGPSNPVRDPTGSPRDSPSPDPETPDEPGAARYPLVNIRTEGRAISRVLAEARGTSDIQLPRLGNEERGTLRMSVQVHPCPEGCVTRMGVSDDVILFFRNRGTINLRRDSIMESFTSHDLESEKNT